MPNYGPKSFLLADGQSIPAPGYGTWQVDDQTAKQCVEEAIKAGYRHIDTAAAYKNEAGVGKAIASCGLNRDELFITSKCWNDHRGYDQVKAACQQSLDQLGLEYLDLYLLHWPANEVQYPDNWDEINQDSWRAMIDLYKEGKVKAIGVSNFLVPHLTSLIKMEIAPMVDQIEFHPGWTQDDTVALCQNNKILVEAWSPLGHGKLLEHPILVEIGKNHGKSSAQIMIRYALQKGILPLPKSTNKERIASNLDVFDFELNPDEMRRIDSIQNEAFSGSNPSTVTF